MKQKDFDELIKSVKQAGRIRHGEARPSRRFVYRAADVEVFRGRKPAHGATRAVGSTETGRRSKIQAPESRA